MRRLPVLIFFCLGLAGALSAQSYQVFADEYRRLTEQAFLRLGPLRLFPSLGVRDAGFDDNLYFGSDDGAPKKDFTATLSPEIRVYWPLRDVLILTFRENPEYAYFQRETRQRGFANSYGAGFRSLLLRRFVLSGAFGNDVHRRRLSSEFQIPANDRVRSLEAGLSYETARKTSIGITGAFRRISYEEIRIDPADAPVSRLLDREEREMGGSLLPAVSRRVSFLRGTCGNTASGTRRPPGATPKRSRFGPASGSRSWGGSGDPEPRIQEFQSEPGRGAALPRLGRQHRLDLGPAGWPSAWTSPGISFFQPRRCFHFVENSWGRADPSI